MSGFPVTQEQMETHLRDHRFITGHTIEQHLQEMSHITIFTMRQFVMGEFKNEHERLEACFAQSVQEVRDSVQGVHNRTVQAHAEFEGRMGTANATFEQRQAELAAGFQTSDARLREHLDLSQLASNTGLETMQRTFSELLAANKVEIDQRMAQAMSELNTAARSLYQEAQHEARQSSQTGGGGGGGDHGGKGSGGPRERSLYDPRDYKLADLASDLTLAAFKK